MLGFENMARNAKRFRMFTGIALQEFDFLYAELEGRCF